MTNKYSSLARRIDNEVADLRMAVDKCRRAWDSAQKDSGEQDLFLDSVALNLHSIYSGLESLFELIARHIDGAVPNGKNWHSELLLKMQNEMSGSRPAVISPTTRALLDDYRRFRHLVRNVYTVNLHPDRLGKLVEQLPELWDNVQPELNAFAEFLQEISETPDK